MAGIQTWPRRLVLSPRPRHQCRLRHPPAPVLPALPLSLQVRLPLFISTYSSLGSPSVVSSLPATSSANLPIVIGGSCGGATRTESSTFPNLNKAFVVGPGYAPVPYKLVSKIRAGLFVDLADLFPDNIRAPSVFGGKTGGIRVKEAGCRNS